MPGAVRTAVDRINAEFGRQDEFRSLFKSDPGGSLDYFGFDLDDETALLAINIVLTDWASTGPSTADDEAFVLDMLREGEKKWKRSGWPGMPVTHLPLSVSPGFGSLRDRGVIEVVTVTKPSKTTPGETMDYSYVRLEKGWTPPPAPWQQVRAADNTSEGRA